VLPEIERMTHKIGTKYENKLLFVVFFQYIIINGREIDKMAVPNSAYVAEKPFAV
jgi:hypothetical protein